MGVHEKRPSAGHGLRRRIQRCHALLSVMCLAALGCRTASKPASVAVEDVWMSPPIESNATAPRPAPARTDGEAIAIVDGQPIERSRVVDLLVEGHGVGLLEQLIVHDAAEHLLSERGLIVSRADVDAEYERSLDKLLGDAAAGDPPELRRKAAEAMLGEMLATRNVSRREFMIVTRRNAMLRKIVGAELRFDEEQLRAEYARTYGERVEIRHIQLGSRAEFDRVRGQRQTGVGFGELAARYSANRSSAERGGLLPPFTADDTDVPELLRRTAFALAVGEESAPLFIDGWYHLIRVQRRIPAEPISFDQARGDVERSLRKRLTEAAMQELYARLFREAKIEILEPKLRATFFQMHPDHRSAPRE